MGLKEELTSNLKGYIVEYQNKRLYVLEQLVYNKETYLCTVEIEKLPEQILIFLKKKTNNNYEYINDKELTDELFMRVGAIIVHDEIEKAMKESGLEQ